MRKISQREYDVFKAPPLFEISPNADDFFVSRNGDFIVWSRDGKTVVDNLSNLSEALRSIQEYAKKNGITGGIWVVNGTKQKYVGTIRNK